MKVRERLRVENRMSLKGKSNSVERSIDERPDSRSSVSNEEETGTNKDDVTDNDETHQWLSERCLPVSEKLVHQWNVDTFVYDCTYSPFSDLHPAPFTVNGQRFSCAAQYILYHKAMFFGDQETAGKILKSRDPNSVIQTKDLPSKEVGRTCCNKCA